MTVASRPGTASMRKTASPPPPQSCGANANGARSTSEPPYAGASSRNFVMWSERSAWIDGSASTS